jgi:hypothetical protein
MPYFLKEDKYKRQKERRQEKKQMADQDFQLNQLNQQNFQKLTVAVNTSFQMGLPAATVAKTIFDDYDQLLGNPGFLNSKLRDLPMEIQPTNTTDEWEKHFLSLTKQEQQHALTELEDAGKELLKLIAKRRTFFEKLEFDNQIAGNVFLEDVIEEMKLIKARREYEMAEMKATKKAKRDAPPGESSSPGTPANTGNSSLMGFISSAFSSSNPK